MRKILCFVVALLILIFNNTLYAQNKTEENNGWGFGVSLEQNEVIEIDYDVPILVTSYLHCFYFPKNVSPRFRIEPFIGFSKNRTYVYGYRTGYSKVEVTRFVFGSGFLGLKRKNSVQFYYGARFAFVFLVLGDIGRSPIKDESISWSGFHIGPVLGGECFLKESFSIGLEGQLLYTLLSHSNKFYSSEITDYSICSKALIFLRLYF